MRKKLLLVFLFCIAGASLNYFCESKTDGFQVLKIIAGHPFDSRWEVDIPQKEKVQLLKTLDQPFYYLGSGRRCYAFVSEDQKYVLKFARTFQITGRLWSHLPFVQHLLPGLCKEEFDKKAIRRAQNFTGYKIGFECLKEQTGTLFLHLNQTSSLQKNVTLYDKINVKHVLPADNLIFILQKRADSFSSHFKQLLAKSDEASIKQLFSEFALLLKARADQHIADWDLSPRNLGIVDDKLAAFDLDNLKFVPSEKFSKKDLMLRTAKLMIRKLETTRKDLVPFLISEIERVAEDAGEKI